MAYEGGRAHIRDLGGNIVRVATLEEAGGAITVTDGETTVEGVTTLEVSGLSVSGSDGTAGLEAQELSVSDGIAIVRVAAVEGGSFVEAIARDPEGVERARAAVNWFDGVGGLVNITLKDAAGSQIGTLVFSPSLFQALLQAKDELGESLPSIGIIVDIDSDPPVCYLNVPAGGVAIYSPANEAEANIIPISVDPSAGSGVVGGQGSLGLRSTGEAWLKTGAGDTDWTRLATTADLT